MKTSIIRTRAAVAMLGVTLAVSICGVTAYGDTAEGTYTDTIEKLLPFNPGATLTLNGRNGSVKIGVWDQDEIKIVGEKRMRVQRAGSWFARLIGLKTPKIETDEEARMYLDQFTIEVTGDADGLQIRTVRPEAASSLRFKMDYTILLPRRADVSVEVTNGGIDVRGVTGQVHARTTNGSIEFNDIAGLVSARTTNGRIELDGISGGVEARTVNGRIVVEVAAFTDTNAGITCRTTNGSIRLGLPRDGNFDLKARTSSSRIESEFTMSSTLKEERKEIEGTVGTGGPLVNLRTTNGSIEVEAI